MRVPRAILEDEDWRALQESAGAIQFDGSWAVLRRRE